MICELPELNECKLELSNIFSLKNLLKRFKVYILAFFILLVNSKGIFLSIYYILTDSSN